MWKTDSVYLLLFGSGLIGGFGHCIGMCGPVVAGLSLGMPGGRSPLIASLLFNLGRITTYTIIGGLMGLTGGFTSIAESAGDLQKTVMTVLGALMAAAGIINARLFSLRRARRDVPAQPGLLTAAVHRVIRTVSRTGGSGLFYPVGLAIGFIPCGLSYTAYIGAAAAGAAAPDPLRGLLRGAALLLLFGLGTSPALMLVGGLAGLRPAWLRDRAQLVSSLLMLAAGILFILRGLA